jgi:hypothetical protein
VWAAGSNGDAQLGLGPEPGIKNPEFRLVRRLKGKASPKTVPQQCMLQYGECESQVRPVSMVRLQLLVATYPQTQSQPTAQPHRLRG